jgi:hypothetical protein
MLDQMQVSSTSLSTVVSTSAPRLLALLDHPEFQRGLVDGQEEFLGSYQPAPLTQEEMIQEVELNLSHWVTERCKKLCALNGWEPGSYFYDLGFTIGLIDKGLTYAR